MLLNLSSDVLTDEPLKAKVQFVVLLTASVKLNTTSGVVSEVKVPFWLELILTVGAVLSTNTYLVVDAPVLLALSVQLAVQKWRDSERALEVMVVALLLSVLVLLPTLLLSTEMKQLSLELALSTAVKVKSGVVSAVYSLIVGELGVTVGLVTSTISVLGVLEPLLLDPSVQFIVHVWVPAPKSLDAVMLV